MILNPVSLSRKKNPNVKDWQVHTWTQFLQSGWLMTSVMVLVIFPIPESPNLISDLQICTLESNYTRDSKDSLQSFLFSIYIFLWFHILNEQNMDIEGLNQNSSRTKSMLDSYHLNVIDSVHGLWKLLEEFFQSLFQKVISIKNHSTWHFIIRKFNFC